MFDRRWEREEAQTNYFFNSIRIQYFTFHFLPIFQLSLSSFPLLSVLFFQSGFYQNHQLWCSSDFFFFRSWKPISIISYLSFSLFLIYLFRQPICNMLKTLLYISTITKCIFLYLHIYFLPSIVPNLFHHYRF